MIKVANLSVGSGSFKWHHVKDTKFNFMDWLENRYRLYDADNCGTQIDYWVKMEDGNPTFYKFTHSWWWHNYGKEDANVENEYETAKVTREELDDEAKKNLKFVV